MFFFFNFFMFYQLNFHPESTTFTIISREKDISQIFKSTYNTHPGMEYVKVVNLWQFYQNWSSVNRYSTVDYMYTMSNNITYGII